jgi:hypothetical protein
MFAGVMFALSAFIASAANGASGKVRTRRASIQWPWTEECQS